MEFVKFEGPVKERISTQLSANNEALNDEGDSDKTDGDEAEEDECDNTHSNAMKLDEAGEGEDDSGFDTDSTMDLQSRYGARRQGGGLLQHRTRNGCGRRVVIGVTMALSKRYGPLWGGEVVRAVLCS
jgi:hypothetical protein